MSHFGSPRGVRMVITSSMASWEVLYTDEVFSCCSTYTMLWMDKLWKGTSIHSLVLTHTMASELKWAILGALEEVEWWYQVCWPHEKCCALMKWFCGSTYTMLWMDKLWKGTSIHSFVLPHTIASSHSFWPPVTPSEFDQILYTKIIDVWSYHGPTPNLNGRIHPLPSHTPPSIYLNQVCCPILYLPIRGQWHHGPRNKRGGESTVMTLFGRR